MVRPPAFEELDHTADLALLIRGATLPELFVNAARAMFAQMTDQEPGQPAVKRRVRVTGIDVESLLVAWLNELLFLSETKREVYSGFQIHSLSARELRATVKGGPSAELDLLIKSATFHNLTVEAGPEGFQATVVLDV